MPAGPHDKQTLRQTTQGNHQALHVSDLGDDQQFETAQRGSGMVVGAECL